ncbi:hypothetical protein JYK21_29550 [Ralstonia pickettii]|nr:hypothetical protein [Ralstonia pickettii]
MTPEREAQMRGDLKKAMRLLLDEQREQIPCRASWLKSQARDKEQQIKAAMSTALED